MSDDRKRRIERDAWARSQAQRIFDRPLVLEAGAGTGKTATLVARVLAWSLGEGWRRAARELEADGRGRPEPEAIARRTARGLVLITFTEAAQAEMAERVGLALASLIAGDTPVGFEREALGELSTEEVAGRASALAGALEQAFIGTIHAYCLRLLVEHAFEAGLHPGARVDADGIELENLVREVIEANLERLYGRGEDPGPTAARRKQERRAAARLARDGHGPAEIAAALQVLLESGARPEDLDAEPFASHSVHAFALRVRQAVEAVARHLAGRSASFGRSRNAALTTEAVEATHAAFATLPEDLAGLKVAIERLLDSTVLARLAEWSKAKFTGSESAVFGAEVEDVQRASGPLLRLAKHLGRLDPERLEAGRSVLFPLLGEARQLMDRRGLLAFQDLLRGARDLVRQDAALQRRLRRSVAQLMVDEFQDTDPVQCDLVRCLALEGPVEERPGLFVVGDPKQSIYGWRSADLSAYQRFCDWVRAEGGEVLPLVVNRRSSSAILAEVERTLAPAMVFEDGLQPHFEPLYRPEGDEPAELAAPGQAAAIEYWDAASTPDDEEEEDTSDTRTPVDARRRAEANAIARDILELRGASGGELRWSDFALLLRSTSSAEIYLEAFKAAGIPFELGRDRSYFRRREVIDAVGLVRAVFDPNDQVALVTWLRSPAVGVPDAALLPLWRAGFPALAAALDGEDETALERAREAMRRAERHLPREVAATAELPGWCAALEEALHALYTLRKEARSLPADRFVERLRRRSLIEGVESARFLGPFRLANLERFFRELAEALEEGNGDPQRVLRTLRVGVERQRDAQQGRPLEPEAEAVRVMTIHGSKGLEFGCVYVADMERKPLHGRAATGTEFAFEEGDPHYVLFGAPTLDQDRIEYQRERVARAEEVRLIYVAMTRAKRRLVLAGGWDSSTQQSSLAGYLRARTEGAQREPGTRGLEDEHGVRWRFPGLEQPAPGGAAEPAEPTGADGIDGSRLTRDAAELARRSEAAARRAGRSRLGPIGRAATNVDFAPLAHGKESPATSAKPASGAPSPAARAGSAMHRVLERLPLDGPRAALEGELARARAELLRDANEEQPLGAAHAEECLARFDQLARAFADGPLLAHFESIAPRVIARELPLLAPIAAPITRAEESDPEDTTPLDAWAGTIDLVYRDGRSGDLVIVDHKTDAARTPAERAERLRHHAAQIGLYATALRAALPPGTGLRCELWFLASGEVVPLFDAAG